MNNRPNNRSSNGKQRRPSNSQTRRRRKNYATADEHEKIILHRLKLWLCLIMVGIFFAGIYKVWGIKIKHGTEYETAAINNQINKIRDEIITPNRGDILDRNKQTLATSTNVSNIVLDVRLLAEQTSEVQTETVTKIGEILGIDTTEITEGLKTDAENKPAKDTNYWIIAKKVDYDKGQQIDNLKYGWLYSETDTQRKYTNTTLAAQVLGFMRGDSSWGIESEYNSYMIGIPGRNFRTTEANTKVRTQIQEAIKGDTVITTLDSTMQQFADDACKTAYNSYKCEFTSSIIMNPNTGEVYAMAQYPSFNSNSPMELTEFESDSELESKWDSLTDEERSEYANKAWKNINISETFEPGSIYKPIVAAMALEEGVITPESTFVCNGSKQIAGLDKAISCWQHAGHGTIDVQGVLAGSCNVGMMDIISKLSPETYLKYHHDFGFHQKTGIDLPGEAAADSETLQYTLDTLHTAEMATSSFGQGFNCTALQALNAFNATINGGKLMRPYVVSQVVDANGKIVKENSPQVVRQVISQETSDYMRKAMQATVSPTGTAKKAVIQGYALGGKTGTAEQGARDKTNWTLSFISYLSVDSPDIVVMTVIHRPEDYYDGCDISPVPMLRGIMEKIINYKAIPPDTTSSDDSSDYGNNMIELKSYQGKNLKSSIEELIGLGLDFDIISAGGDTITNQYPSAGTAIEKGGKVMLSVQSTGATATTEVPNVVGMDSQSAKEMLEAVGFSCYIYNINDDIAAENSTQTATTQSETATQITTEEATDENDTVTDNKLTVVEQSPAAGKKLESGTIVRIKVS